MKAEGCRVQMQTMTNKMDSTSLWYTTRPYIYIYICVCACEHPKPFRSRNRAFYTFCKLRCDTTLDVISIFVVLPSAAPAATAESFAACMHTDIRCKIAYLHQPAPEFCDVYGIYMHCMACRSCSAELPPLPKVVSALVLMHAKCILKIYASALADWLRSLIDAIHRQISNLCRPCPSQPGPRGCLDKSVCSMLRSFDLEY